jgi:diguanylate cyclase (GGDEF)-like protein
MHERAGDPAACADERAWLLDRLAALEDTTYDIDRQLPDAQQAEQHAAALGDYDLVLRSRLAHADALLRLGRTAAGGRMVRDVSRAAEETAGAFVLARTAGITARFYLQLGNAQALLEQAVRSVELLPPDAPTHVRYDHELNLAVAHAVMRNFGQARALFRRLRREVEEAGELQRLPMLLNNAAYAEYECGETAAALELAEAMADASDQLGTPLDLTLRDTLARVYLANDRLQDARDALDAALEPSVCGVVEGDAAANCELTRAEVLLSLGDLEGAAVAIKRTLARSEEQGLGRVHARAQLQLSKLFAARGEFEEAYKRHTIFHDEWAQVTATERDAHARIIQAVYETAEAREESARYRELSMRDPLTGLANRRFVDEQLPGLLAEVCGGGMSMAIAMVDLDHFKQINDRLSHETGDEVLATLAGILADHATGGFAGRMGGEEFLVVVPVTDVAEAWSRLERLRAAVASHDWSPVTGPVPVTASIGVSVATAVEHGTAGLLRRADAALYAAKDKGRNRVEVAV